jgi:hypothetical protein
VPAVAVEVGVAVDAVVVDTVDSVVLVTVDAVVSGTVEAGLVLTVDGVVVSPTGAGLAQLTATSATSRTEGITVRRRGSLLMM